MATLLQGKPEKVSERQKKKKKRRKWGLESIKWVSLKGDRNCALYLIRAGETDGQEGILCSEALEHQNRNDRMGSLGQQPL